MSSAETTTETRATEIAAGAGRAVPSRRKKPVRKRRISPFWMKQIHMLHWMSSALCLVSMLLFAVTGFTLNHAADIQGDVETQTVEAKVPEQLLSDIQGEDEISPELEAWIMQKFGASVSGRAQEWSDDELYVPLPRPGGDGWLAIDRMTGDAVYENTDRGVISFLNDLHKGRDTGVIWSWFIDIFALGCLFFALSGLLLLYIHSRFRSSTWPIVGAGLALPLIIIILFVHS